MITLVPAVRPVTNPEELIVATLGVPEVQVAPEIGIEPVSCVVDPTQTTKEPVMAVDSLTTIVGSTAKLVSVPPFFLNIDVNV